MNSSFSRSKAEQRLEERERRYPFYSAIDFSLQLVVSLGVLIGALLLLGIILLNSSPQYMHKALTIARQITG